MTLKTFLRPISLGNVAVHTETMKFLVTIVTLVTDGTFFFSLRVILLMMTLDTLHSKVFMCFMREFYCTELAFEG